MSLSFLQTQAYSNWLMLSPGGIEMCRCAEKRANWYLDRGLADIVADDPPTIKLRFIPNGYGNKDDAFSLAKKHNRCVVCGTEENLTKHHIVPHMYRKFFPIKIKSRSAHDVVVICVQCHEKYEAVATDLKNLLTVELIGKIVPINKPTTLSATHNKISGLCRTLIKYGDSIPDNKRDKIVKEIATYLGKSPSSEDMQVLAAEPHMSLKSLEPGKVIVEKIIQTNQLERFIIRWRQHFIDTAQPKFMPEHWNIDRKVETNNEQVC